MTHRRQKELSQELDQRLPRGPRGSLQNELRMRYWIWRLTGHSFEESLALAVEGIRKSAPGFEPQLLPATLPPPSPGMPTAQLMVG